MSDVEFDCPRCSQKLECRGVEVPRLHELAAKDPVWLPRLDPVVLGRFAPDAFANVEAAARAATVDQLATVDRLMTQDRPRIPLAESMRLTALSKQCPYRSPPSCGCAGAAACGLRGGADVQAQECWDCVGRYGA